MKIYKGPTRVKLAETYRSCFMDTLRVNLFEELNSVPRSHVFSALWPALLVRMERQLWSDVDRRIQKEIE